jgi:chromosome segregation ATPase
MGYIDGSRRLLYKYRNEYIELKARHAKALTGYHHTQEALNIAANDLHETTVSNIQLRQMVDSLFKDVEEWKNRAEEAAKIDVKQGSPDSLEEGHAPREYLEDRIAELEAELEKCKEKQVDTAVQILDKQNRIDELERVQCTHDGCVDIQHISPLNLDEPPKKSRKRKHKH